ncbi:hypothetical protein [Methylomicrobium lacus]|uniref:hypothetical protein n=1 Tax=Methylomicrobium lacus TaxID=136992 RepID=UPI0035A9A117
MKVILILVNYFWQFGQGRLQCPEREQKENIFSADDTTFAPPYRLNRSPAGRPSTAVAAAVVCQQDRGGLSIAGR